jgi:ketosteroid isomerase-like protein
VSEEKIHVVRKVMDAISRRDLPALLEHLDADVRLYPLMSAWPQTYRGHDGVEQWWRDVGQLWEHFGVRPESFRDLADGSLLVQISWRGRGTGAVAELEGPATAVIRFHDTKVASMEIHLDEAHAMRTIGDTTPG